MKVTWLCPCTVVIPTKTGVSQTQRCLNLHWYGFAGFLSLYCVCTGLQQH